MDPESERWPVYEAVVGLHDTWHDSCRPELYTSEDSRVLQYLTQEHLDECMEDAKAITAAGYEQVLEDGLGVCSSESEADYGDHGEQWLNSGMYTPDMLDEKGKPLLARATMII
jgi:hypothetical protein